MSCNHYQTAAVVLEIVLKDVNMLKDASPVQGCLTSNAFRTLPSLSPRLHKWLYVPASFTVHSLGRRRATEKGKAEEKYERRHKKREKRSRGERRTKGGEEPGRWWRGEREMSGGGVERKRELGASQLFRRGRAAISQELL